MTTWRMASDLAAILVPLGVAGTVIAGLCALVAGIAIVRRAGGLAGGAVGVWIPAAMMSSIAGFANQWIPLLIASAMLAASLVLGAVVRGVMTANGVELPVRKVEADAAAEAPVATSSAVATASPLTMPNPARAV